MVGINPSFVQVHSEINSVIFNKWVEEQLVPALPPKSLVVMDNASYHSVIKEGTKAPTSATRKGDMQKWLKDKKIPSNITLDIPHTISIGLNSQWYGERRNTS
jgi:hypothetical protein